MTREEILHADPAQLNEWIDEHLMGGDDSFGDWSGNLSSAWEVLEVFPLVMIERVEIFEGNVTVNVTIYPDSSTEKSVTGSARTLPHAASIASLLAVMEGKEKEE